MRFMLDTDIASYLIRGDHPGVTEKFTEFYENCVMSSITAAELQYGARKRNNRVLTKKVQFVSTSVRRKHHCGKDSRGRASSANPFACLDHPSRESPCAWGGIPSYKTRPVHKAISRHYCEVPADPPAGNQAGCISCQCQRKSAQVCIFLG